MPAARQAVFDEEHELCRESVAAFVGPTQVRAGSDEIVKEPIGRSPGLGEVRR